MFSETPTARPVRSTRKSGLAHEILAQEAVIEAGPSTEIDVGASSQAAHAHAHDDYLLSHLTEAADGRGDGQIPLDSSSFAAFLPQSPTDAAHAHEQLESTLAAAAQAEETVAQAISETPNILSRLKRGPPGSCDICGRTQTSVWRKLSLGGEDHKVCNGELNIVEAMQLTSSVWAVPHQVWHHPSARAVGRRQERQEAQGVGAHVNRGLRLAQRCQAQAQVCQVWQPVRRARACGGRWRYGGRR